MNNLCVKKTNMPVVSLPLLLTVVFKLLHQNNQMKYRYSHAELASNRVLLFTIQLFPSTMVFIIDYLKIAALEFGSKHSS